MSTGAVFPVGLTLKGAEVAVTGNNEEAADKLCRLLNAGAQVTVFCPGEIPEHLAQVMANQELAGGAGHVPNWLTPAEVGRFRMVVSTRMDRDYSDAIAQACRQAGVLVSCYDKPEFSDFAMPALVTRGHLQVAIWTGGNSPTLARKIRQALERLFDDKFEAFLNELGHLRKRLKVEEPDFDRRRERLHAAVEGFEIEGTIKYPKSHSPER